MHQAPNRTPQEPCGANDKDTRTKSAISRPTNINRPTVTFM